MWGGTPNGTYGVEASVQSDPTLVLLLRRRRRRLAALLRRRPRMGVSLFFVLVELRRERADALLPLLTMLARDTARSSDCLLRVLYLHRHRSLRL